MQVSVDRELLARYIQGECNPEELEQVKAFLFQPQWQEALDALLEEDFAAFGHVAPATGESRRWHQRFREKRLGQTPVRPFWQRHWTRYAAAFMILAGTAFLFSRRFQKPVRQQVAWVDQANPRGQRSRITLPDSSVVHLGAASSIRYPATFGEARREIILEGEAFFEVSPDQQHPFIVRTAELQTRVLGTSFKIDAFDQVTVSVATGKVQVSRQDSTGAAGQSLAVLTPGQQLAWNSTTHKATLLQVAPQQVEDWKEGKMTFVNTPLATIAATLERWYNVEIRLSNTAIARTRLSLIVKATVPLRHSLDIICSTAHLTYEEHNSVITITKH